MGTRTTTPAAALAALVALVALASPAAAVAAVDQMSVGNKVHVSMCTS